MKKLMIRGAVASLILAGATGALLVENVRAYSAREGTVHRQFVCSEKVLKGTYGIQMHGTRPLPAGGTEAVIGNVIRTFDGAGGFAQVDNIKGSIAGFVPDRPGSGTYTVNADCSGTTVFEPAPGISIEEHLIIVDYGHEVRSITVQPAPIMVSTVGKRIGWR